MKPAAPLFSIVSHDELLAVRCVTLDRGPIGELAVNRVLELEELEVGAFHEVSVHEVVSLEEEHHG